MAKTYYSMGLLTADESWRMIRTIRAEPSGGINETLEVSAARRRDFQMALEQAQQQYIAAAQVGYESRPLNLFYGLSQAGRAIAAASPKLGGRTGRHWQGAGHGLHFDTEIGSMGPLMSRIKVGDGSADLFSRLSTAIGSPSDLRSVTFGEVLEQIPDYGMEFRDESVAGRAIHNFNLYTAPVAFPLELEVQLPGLPPEGPLDESAVRAIADHYPALRALQVSTLESGLAKRSHNPGRIMFTIDNIEQLTRSPSGPYVPSGAMLYRRNPVLLPEIGEVQREVRPLASWWIVLFALSMLARYAPHHWTRAMSISESRIASRVEFILDTALHAVPELIWSELALIKEPTRPVRSRFMVRLARLLTSRNDRIYGWIPMSQYGGTNRVAVADG
ncbi:YaaC family protein [Leifsonia sp. NPDC056665]|uniref:YaaC family protein n=1 Tax=Leifsonia sp. NPDC056665 TaxID=3345901 RepID=UPI0036AA0298